MPLGQAAAYRVLARKYRPATFAELIGQDAMVRTLTNAFASGRIAQAYMLTGVRGVGKTTTARILARALNYEADGVAGPTVDMPALGVHCAAIMASRHPDVFEMDAASNTGIDDIREIIGYAQTRPTMARYKVFIIDEVHMLSRQAFNGLLKTLEEPPEHARFIFATTEVRKVPVTVLSRCQRFDLRRVEAASLVSHFAAIAAKEGARIEPDALSLIARAAEGSVRDGLSLLDQALALGHGEVVEAEVRAMLGVADRARIGDLFGMLMAGDAAGALEEFKDQYEQGAEPLVVLGDIAAFVHLVTRARVTPVALDDPALSQAEREAARSFAERLGMAPLARAWQMLLKGLQEVDTARNPHQAAEMVLIRLACAADLPTPGEVIRALREEGPTMPASPARQGAPGTPASAASAVAPSPPRQDPARPAAPPTPVSDAPQSDVPQPVVPLMAEPQSAEPQSAEPQSAEPPLADIADHHLPEPRDFADAIRIVGDLDIRLIDVLEREVRPASFSPGHIEVTLSKDAPADIASRFGAALSRASGSRWVVSVAGAGEGGGETLREARARDRAEREAAIAGHPVVDRVMTLFPAAELVEVRDLAPAGPGLSGAGEMEADMAGEAPDAADDEGMTRRA